MHEIEILVGAPGCGKTDQLRKEAINQPGLYLFCLPTIDLIKEQVARLEVEAKGLIVLRADSGTGRGAVQRKLDSARAQITASGLRHAIVFATHITLMQADLSGFAGWHIRIDEAPNATNSGSINIGQSCSLFQAHLDLTPVGNGNWATATLKGAAVGWQKWQQDAVTKPLVDFFKLVSSPSGIFVKGSDWESLNTLEWCSIWTPSALTHFDTIQIAGASYHSSLGAVVTRSALAGQVRTVDKRIGGSRSGQPAIRIHYFTSGHAPSTTLWNTSEGRRRIKAVCDYLESSVPDLGYWSGNKKVLELMDWRAPGNQVLPKVSGQNKWRSLDKCAFIYSSRALPADEPIKDLCSITDEQIRRAREFEDILQFVMRGAVRNSDFDGNYDVYLYSKEQSEWLHSWLVDNGIGRSVELIPLYVAGIMNESGVKPKNLIGTNSAKLTAITKITAKVMSPKGKPILPKSLKRHNQRLEKKSNKSLISDDGGKLFPAISCQTGAL